MTLHPLSLLANACSIGVIALYGARRRSRASSPPNGGVPVVSVGRNCPDYDRHTDVCDYDDEGDENLTADELIVTSGAEVIPFPHEHHHAFGSQLMETFGADIMVPSILGQER